MECPFAECLLISRKLQAIMNYLYLVKFHHILHGSRIFANYKKPRQPVYQTADLETENDEVHCIAMASNRSAEQQQSNSHFFSIPILLAFFPAKSASPTVFRMRILLAFFSAKSTNSSVSEFALFWQLKCLSAKPAVFERLRRLQMPKRIRPKSQSSNFRLKLISKLSCLRSQRHLISPTPSRLPTP